MGGGRQCRVSVGLGVHATLLHIYIYIYICWMVPMDFGLSIYISLVYRPLLR